MKVETMTELSILAAIETLQEVQRSNSPKSEIWQEASRQLQPLFAEMAKREQSKTAQRYFSKHDHD